MNEEDHSRKNKCFVRASFILTIAIPLIANYDGKTRTFILLRLSMFHLIHGKKEQIGNITYITNESYGIQVHYQWKQSSGSFLLHPHIDENNKTIEYFAFDTPEEKQLFKNMAKISGIGNKTAFHIANIDPTELKEIIETLDTKALTQIRGIGPKSAKRIMVELKQERSKQELNSIAQNKNPIRKQIVKQLQTLGYERLAIENALDQYSDPIQQTTQKEVIKRLIKKL